MAFKIERITSFPTPRYPYNCRVTFNELEDVFDAQAWTAEHQIPCTWVGYALYISDRYTDFLALKYSNATYY